MALTQHDFDDVRSIVRDETKKFVTKNDLRESTRELRTNLVNKADLKEALAETEDRLGKKIELETEKVARMVAKESARLRKRDDELARHSSHTFEPEAEQSP